MQSQRKKTGTILIIVLMFIMVLLSCGTVPQPPVASEETTPQPQLKLGVYKSGNGIVNAYGEKLYVRYSPQLAQTYKNLPPPVRLLISDTGKQKITLVVRQSNSDEYYCGEEATAPHEKANEIRDIIDHLPTVSEDMHISDPFYLLASEVSYREENGKPVTFDELVKSCSEYFNPPDGGMAYNLVYLNHGNNWSSILNAYQARYGNDYPAIRDALTLFKTQATQYAREHNLPTGEETAPTPTPTEVPPTPIPSPRSGTIGEIVEAPASLLDESDWNKRYVLMPEQEWQDTSFPESGISNATKWLDAIQTIIDIGGMVPTFSPINGVNALIYLMRGDKLNALLSAGAMIPFLSDEIIGAKLTKRGLNVIEEIAKITKLKKIGTAAAEAIVEIKKVLKSNVEELFVKAKKIFIYSNSYEFETFEGLKFRVPKSEIPPSEMNEIDDIASKMSRETFNKNPADPFRDVLGPGLKSHPTEWNDIISKVEKAGGKVRYSDDGTMAYQPGLSKGVPGEIVIDRNASIEALKHEYQHFLDDMADGWSGMAALYDFKLRSIRELRSYMVEIRDAENLGLTDVANKLWENYLAERKYIIEKFGPSIKYEE